MWEDISLPGEWLVDVAMALKKQLGTWNWNILNIDQSVNKL